VSYALAGVSHTGTNATFYRVVLLDVNLGEISSICRVSDLTLNSSKPTISVDVKAERVILLFEGVFALWNMKEKIFSQWLDNTGQRNKVSLHFIGFSSSLARSPSLNRPVGSSHGQFCAIGGDPRSKRLVHHISGVSSSF
jgi:hypothetical protein